MNHELWSSGQYNNKRKKQTTKWANHKMLCRCNDTGKSWGDANFKVTWYENRSRGTRTGHVVQNLRALSVVFGVIRYPRDAPT